MGNGANPDSQTLQVIGLWARQFMRGTPEEVPVPRKINSILYMAGNLNKGVGGEYFCLTIRILTMSDEEESVSPRMERNSSIWKRVSWNRSSSPNNYSDSDERVCLSLLDACS